MLRVIVLLADEPLPSLKSFADSIRFSTRIALYLAPSIFPSVLTSFPVPAEEKHPHSMMLPRPCFTVGMVCSGCWVSATHSVLHWGQKVTFWSHPDQSTFFHMFAVSPTWLVANSKWDFLGFTFNNGFLLATLPLRPDWWSKPLIVVLWTDSPTSAVDLCSSSRVTMGLLVAPLINFLLVWLVSLGGRPCLGRVAVLPYSFHFLMMDFMVLREMFKA